MAAHEDLGRTHEVAQSSNRSFGWVFGAVFLVIGAWPLVHGEEPRWWALVVSGTFLVITLAAPNLLGPLNKLWSRFGLLLNGIVSPAALAILFYLVVTPLGWLMRALGKDNLR